jgi:hypothetical protein
MCEYLPSDTFKWNDEEWTKQKIEKSYEKE